MLTFFVRTLSDKIEIEYHASKVSFYNLQIVISPSDLKNVGALVSFELQKGESREAAGDFSEVCNSLSKCILPVAYLQKEPLGAQVS
jgi:hypothetical protein